MKKKVLLIVIVLVVIALISYLFIYPKFNNHADDTKNCKTYGTSFELVKSVNESNGKYNYYCCDDETNPPTCIAID